MGVKRTVHFAVGVLLVWTLLFGGAITSRAEGNVVLALDVGAGHMPLDSWREFCTS